MALQRRTQKKKKTDLNSHQVTITAGAVKQQWCHEEQRWPAGERVPAAHSDQANFSPVLQAGGSNPLRAVDFSPLICDTIFRSVVGGFTPINSGLLPPIIPLT